MNLNSKKNISYLIYDSCAEDILSKIIDLRKAKILNFRKYKNKITNFFFEIPSILNIFTNINLLKIFFLEGFFIAHVCEKIKRYKPKYVLTTTDNDIRFYRLKKFNQSIKFIAIQNGLRSKFHDIFEKLETKNILGLSADYYCSYNDHVKKLIKKYIDTSVISTGSYINNHVKIKKNFKKKNNILYISSFRNVNPEDEFDRFANGKIIYWKDFIKFEIDLIKGLQNFCIKKGYNLSIAGSSTNNSDKEFNFFKKNLSNRNWKFFKKTKRTDTYNLIDKFEIVSSCAGTSGVEAIGRNCKVAYFGRDISIYKDWLYAWPKKMPKKGFFYSDSVSSNEINRILNNLITVKETTWKTIVMKERKHVMTYDYSNTKLKKILKS